MIITILVFELTVASHQRMTVKNRCLYSVTSLGSPDTGRKKVEAKRLAGTLKTEVVPSSRQREKELKKISCWTGFVADGTKSQVLRVKEDEENLGQEAVSSSQY